MSQANKWLNNNPTNNQANNPMLDIGRVQSTKDSDGYYIVVGPLGITRAKRAVSCLIEPQAKDKVLIMLAENPYILHILEREESEAKLVLPSQTEICLLPCKENAFEMDENATKNSLQINVQNMQLNCTENLSLYSTQDISMASNKITATSKKLNLAAHSMIFTGQILHSRFDNIRTTCKHAVEKIHHFFGLYHKKIDHADDLIEMQSKRTSIKNEDTLRIQNKNTHIRSENSVDMDGKNIRIG